MCCKLSQRCIPGPEVSQHLFIGTQRTVGQKLRTKLAHLPKRRYPHLEHPSGPALLISGAAAIKKHLSHLRTILVPKSLWVGSEKLLVQMLRDRDDAC